MEESGLQERQQKKPAGWDNATGPQWPGRLRLSLWERMSECNEWFKTIGGDTRIAVHGRIIGRRCTAILESLGMIAVMG